MSRQQSASNNSEQEQIVENNSTTHETIMLDGGFTIVSNNNNQRRANNTQQALMMASSWKKKRKVLAQAEQHENNSSFARVGGNTMIDLIEFNPIRFESQLEKVREKLSEFILNCFINDNYQFLTHQVICYGIGDFVTDKIALSQFKVLLSIFERLRDKINQSEEKIQCLMYDPIFEIKMDEQNRNKLYTYLKEKYSIEWITTNEECKRRINEKTLIYMPHCAFSMYYNLLMENKDQLENIILLSNQLPLKTALIKDAYSVDSKKQIILSNQDDSSSSTKLVFHKKKTHDENEKYLLNFVFNNTNIYIFKSQAETTIPTQQDIDIFALSQLDISRALNREADSELISK